MAALRPFASVRYRLSPSVLSQVLCPPFDTIPPEEARRFRRHPLNAIHLELPSGGSRRYRRARRLWDAWLRSGILVRDPRPAFYLLEHVFRWGSRRRSRLGIFAGLSFFSGRGRVIPHERTFGKYREDRRRLLSALRANTSPVFLLCPDPRLRLRKELLRARRARPLVRAATPWGGAFRLWRLRRTAVLSRLLAQRPFLIADGHHRFRVSREHALAGGCDEGCLVYLCSDGDPGLLLLPTHRVLRAAASFWRRLERRCVLRPLSSSEDLERRLAAASGECVFGIYARGRCWLAHPRRRFAGLPVEWLDEGLRIRPIRDRVRYTHVLAEALRRADQDRGVALLLPAPRLKEVWAAVRRAGLLPEKTTYFYPKVPTGLVFRELPIYKEGGGRPGA
jgi:uncharacterized protein (DUF1015 family)